jgi:DNA-binding CsgD family transcriptional regulator
MGFLSGTSFSMEQVVPYCDFKKTEYYNDFIRPQKIRRQMVVYIRVNDNLTSVICTHRSRDRRFNREDRAAGDLVSSHLSSAFERIQMIEEVKKKGGFFQMILDNTELGVAVLDLERKPIFINRKAAEISAGIRKDDLPAHAHRCVDWIIPPPVLKDCEAVKKIHGDDRKSGVDSFPARKRVMRVSSFEKCLFRSRIVDSPLTDFSHPLFLVTMETLPVQPEIDEQAVRRDYNLTKREAEIVSHIFKGYRNAEIAEKLFISEGTVKNHLRNIFEKAGVGNRTALIHKVLSI